jgi:hypothetical protein
LNKFFRLPSSFPLRVITPLHLVEVAGLSSSDPGLVIDNFYWILWIDKIGLQLQLLYVNHLFWNTEAFPELRDMKYIMNRG